MNSTRRPSHRSLAVPPGNLLGAWLTAPVRRLLHIQSWSVWLYPGLGAVLLGLAGLRRPRRWWVHAKVPKGGNNELPARISATSSASRSSGR